MKRPLFVSRFTQFPEAVCVCDRSFTAPIRELRPVFFAMLHHPLSVRSLGGASTEVAARRESLPEDTGQGLTSREYSADQLQPLVAPQPSQA